MPFRWPAFSLIASWLVPRGGPNSPVKANCPASSIFSSLLSDFIMPTFFHSTKSLFFRQRRLPVLISRLYKRLRCLISPIVDRADILNLVKAVLRLQSFINHVPGTGLILVDLAALSIRTATGAIEQRFGTHGHRTNPGRQSQQTVAAGAALFLIPANTPIGSDEGGVDSWKH